jgi:pyruvate carboxylase
MLTVPRTTVAVFSYEDRMSIHRQKADEAFLIGARGQFTPVGAYVCPRDTYCNLLAGAR